jgi:cold shock CspA family protein
MQYDYNKPYKGKIRWFDSLRGEGLVRMENGESIFIERSAILVGDDKYEYSEKNEAILDKHVYQGQEVYVRVLQDSHFTAISWYLPADPAEACAYLDDL